jgi:pre-rRNA-processing protein TSR1
VGKIDFLFSISKGYIATCGNNRARLSKMTGESKQHHHRSGGLRQNNKKNKRSVASKRSVTKRQGGRVNAAIAKRIGSTAGSGSSSKWNRRNHQKQLRLQKRNELISQRNGTSSAATFKSLGNEFSNEKPSRMVGIISLSSIHSSAAQQMESQVRQNIAAVATTILPATTTATCCHYSVHKKDGYLTFLTASKEEDDEDAAVLAALDMARMCDTILFVLDEASSLDGDVPVASIQINKNSETDQSTLRSSVNDSAWEHLISSRGDRILAALKGQGLPTPLTIVAKSLSDLETDGLEQDKDHDIDMLTLPSMTKSIHRSIWKRRVDLKKYATRFATSEFGTTHNKVFELVLVSNPDPFENVEATETASSTVPSSIAPSKSNPTAVSLVRSLCTMNCHPPLWISQSSRPYIINESQSFLYDPSLRKLSITGSIRSWNGVPLDVNALFHIPGVGTVACQSIQKVSSPWHQYRLERSTTKNGMVTTECDMASPLIVHADPDKRESLNMYATPDALDGEQNLIGFDEADEEDHVDMNNEIEEKGASRPAGWSDYQSAWIDSVNDDFNDNHTADDDGVDHGELAEQLNRKRSCNDTVATNGMDMDDGDYEVSEEERQSLQEQRRRQHKEETEFPDEVQVPEDIKARDRFARYRSLKSFRKSVWDAKENLPDSYATIFHFSNFKQTQRSVFNDMSYLAREASTVHGAFFGTTLPNSSGDNDEMTDDNDDDVLEGCVPRGLYVTLTFENVLPEMMKCVAPDAVLAAVALLPHENKVAVIHMGLSQSLGCDATNGQYPIKSKDVLTVRCGWRTWKARPVFSQNNLNCDKHKFERFLPTGGAFFAASVFGPVTYTPCPVLVFREKSPHIEQQQLVAIGSVLGADADRIVVKRIILTGYPVRVHKRHATVKYMFYDPEDVKWFKPAGLHTKHGLQGNIIQSVGEHGTMKCLFNAPIKQHDTVCLPLYKRIYPKYATPLSNRDIEEKSRSGVTTYRETKPNLVVL